MKEAFDFLIVNINSKSEVFQETSSYFEFISGSALINIKFTELRIDTNGLVTKCNKDLHASEFCLQVQSAKR
jgi:hypothetical protein